MVHRAEEETEAAPCGKAELGSQESHQFLSLPHTPSVMCQLCSMVGRLALCLAGSQCRMTRHGQTQGSLPLAPSSLAHRLPPPSGTLCHLLGIHDFVFLESLKARVTSSVGALGHLLRLDPEAIANRGLGGN